MSAFAQTPDGDLDISSGNLRVETDLAQCTAWKLTNLFSLVKGEWFRDTRIGVPYLQYVFVSSPNLQLISTVFRRVALAAPGVLSVNSIDLQYFPRQRQLGVDIVAFARTGEKLVGGIGKPFIVTGPQQ